MVILIEFLLSRIGSCLYKMNFILFFIIKEMIYEKVIEQKFALVDTAYHMIILSCLALRIIHDCQVLTSFVSCRTGGAIPMQVFFFAFSILGQLEATLDSLGSVNQTKSERISHIQTSMLYLFGHRAAIGQRFVWIYKA